MGRGRSQFALDNTKTSKWQDEIDPVWAGINETFDIEVNPCGTHNHVRPVRAFILDEFKGVAKTSELYDKTIEGTLRHLSDESIYSVCKKLHTM